MPDVSVLDVRLYDEPIGTLTHLQGDRTIFAFNEDYVENPDRPTFSLSFKDDLGGLITNIRPTQRVVPPFFSNLLPEGGLRRYLAERAGVNQQREFFLLWVLGLLLRQLTDFDFALVLCQQTVGQEAPNLLAMRAGGWLRAAELGRVFAAGRRPVNLSRGTVRVSGLLQGLRFSVVLCCLLGQDVSRKQAG
jgi:HipA-like protein